MRRTIKSFFPSLHRPDDRLGDASHNAPTPLEVHDGSDPDEYGLLRVDKQGQPGSIPICTENEYKLDIVFIHGLNGHRKRTWTHENGTFWPRDLLPEVFPSARIYTYGYPSEIFLTRSRATIQDIASNLLSYIDTEYQAQVDVEAPRPIVFVCHSLGGLVLKQAMVIAYARDAYRHVWLKSKGLVFMGTPHRGSKTADLATLLLNMAKTIMDVTGTNIIKGSIRTTFVKDLRPNAPLLAKIAEDFTRIPHLFQIKTFYETDVHPVLNKMIVPKTSAILGASNEDLTPLYANHQDMCRFRGRDDGNFRQVAMALKKMSSLIMIDSGIRGSSLDTQPSFDSIERVCVQQLNTVDIFGYEARLDRRVEGTLDWVFETLDFIKWTSSPVSQLLWVTGHPGCGKTTLAAFIRERLVDQVPSRGLVCRFFCNNKIEDQRDVTAILRSLIAQAVHQQRRLARIVKKMFRTFGPTMFSRFEVLWDIIVQVLHSEETSEIKIIIDAIDECDAETQLILTRSIYQLLEAEITKPIKFIVTSRPNIKAFHELDPRSARLIHLPLEEQLDAITGDIQVVVQKRLEFLFKKGVCKPSTRNALERVLVKKADCTFLWLSLIFDTLEERRILLSHDIESVVARFPGDLRTTYACLLKAIPRKNWDIAAQMLAVIVASDRPLTGNELGIILANVPLNGAVHSLDIAEPEIDEKTVQSVLGPLVRIHAMKIELLHQSFKDYLIDLQHRPDDDLSTHFGVDLVRESASLFYVCISYLQLPELSHPLADYAGSTAESRSLCSSDGVPVSPSDEVMGTYHLFHNQVSDDDLYYDEEVWQKYKIEHPLFDFTALHWTRYLACCLSGLEEVDQLSTLSICEVGTACFTNWIRYHWFEKQRYTPFPSVVNGLIVAAYFGFPDILRTLIDRPSTDPMDFSRAMYWSARQDNASCVELLLDSQGSDVNSRLVDNQTPLGAAAQNGCVNSMMVLLSAQDIDVNAPSERGRTPLSLAAGNGQRDTVIRLLAHSDVSLNREDDRGRTPLLCAVIAGSLDIVTTLLAADELSHNHLDKSHRNVMSWAAEDGASELVRLFLKYSQIQPDQVDIKGRTPFSYAAQHGHVEVLRCLLKSGRINPIAQDKSGRNAHSWAAIHREPEALNYLIRRVPKGADIADDSGWSPIFWALDPPGYPRNVISLLRAGSINVNQKDISGKTCLMWASGYGIDAIVNEFLSIRAVEIEASDYAGRTALSHAAGSGNVSVVDSLLKLSVDINSKDTTGLTPLSRAAREGCLAVVQVLLMNAELDTSIADSEGQTALMLARKYGHHEVASLLAGSVAKN